MASVRLGPTMILIGLLLALFFGATTVLAFAPWWVWAVILFLLVSLTGGNKK